MNENFTKALEKSFLDLKTVDQDLNTINRLINQVSAAVRFQTEDEVTLINETKSKNIGSFLQNMIDKGDGAVGAKSGEIESELVLKPLKAQEPIPENLKIKLTTLKINKKGFPCSIVVNGDINIANDSETLEQYFIELLSDIETAKAIRKILNTL